jgi:hypothetical protein
MNIAVDEISVDVSLVDDDEFLVITIVEFDCE